jgi:hypothetical protein
MTGFARYVDYVLQECLQASESASFKGSTPDAFYKLTASTINIAD